MSDADVIYVAELAAKLGRTEKAIRAGLHKIRRGQAVDWLPPHFRLGLKYAWRVADVDAWLDQQARKGGV